MALTDEGMNTTMLMQPANGVPYGMPYGGGNNLFGGGDSWLGILFLIALCNGGFGFGGFGGGYGAMMGMGMMGGMWGMDYLYPWLNNSQNINDGFRDQQLATQVNGIQNAITSGFGDVQLGIAGVNQNICQTGNGITNAVNQGFASTNLGIANSTAAVQNSLCNGFNGVNNSIFGAQTAISQQLNSNELASLNRSFAEQTANTQGFNGVQAQLAQNGYNQATQAADIKYTIATENCADRYEAAQNTRDITDAIRSGNQMIMDKLCALELDGVKNQLAQAQRENVGLQNQVNMATARAENLANADNIVNSLYSRLSSCPTPSIPVAGNTPLFSCNPSFNSPNTGCGCGSF